MAAVKKRTKTQVKEALRKAVEKAVNAGALPSTAVPKGAQILVTVEIDANHLVPYGVSWDTARLIDALTPQSQTVTVTSGHHALSWAFDHGLEKVWSHKLSVSIDGDAPVVLEKKSSTAGDDPVSIDRKAFDA